MEWTKEKPDYECVFVSRTKVSTPFSKGLFGWKYDLLGIIWYQEEEIGYLALCDNDGDEYCALDELIADEYLVIEKGGE